MPVTWSLQAEYFCAALLTFFGILNATGKLFVFPRDCQLDLQRWLDFLPTWNGVYFFDIPEWVPEADFELSSEASGKKGFGVYNNGAWFYRTWLPAQQPLGMAYKELFPIVLACHIWGQSWSNKRIKFWCDNQSVVHILQSGTSKDDKIMHLVRGLFLVTAKFNFRVCAEHILGKTNHIADSLSCFNLQEFFYLARKLIPHQSTYQRACYRV